MKKIVKIIGIMLVLFIIIVGGGVYSLQYFVLSFINGDEVFDTTTEEVEDFNRSHMIGIAPLDRYFLQIEKKTGAELTISKRQINEKRSFEESTFTKNESNYDTERQVYVDFVYRITVPETSVYTVCETCEYQAAATYEYENGKYVLGPIAFKHDWLHDTLEKSLASIYAETDSIPISPYYYKIVSKDGHTISFSELSNTGYWDKEPENFMFTTSFLTDFEQVQGGIIAGEIFSYAVEDENKPSRSVDGFIQLNTNGSLSLYEVTTPDTKGDDESTAIKQAKLVKTFFPN